MRSHGGAWLAAGLLALAAAPARATSKDSTTHYLKAVLLRQQGRYAQALEEYAAAATLDPQSAYILEEAAGLAIESGQPAQALEFVRRLEKLDPKGPKSRLLLGNVRWARGELEEARKAFEQALRLDPGYPEALLALGTLLGSRDPAKAKAHFEAYAQAKPEHAAQAHYQIAIIESRLGRNGAAVSQLEEAVRLEPDFLQAHYSLAHLYELRKDTEAALGEYLALLSRDPDNVALLAHVGEIHFLRGEVEAARSAFLRAKGAQPGHPVACLWLALIAEQQGDFAAAAKALSESSALKEEPGLAVRLSYYLTQADRLREGIAALEEARKRWPQNDDIAYFLALGYDDLKERGKALDLLQELARRRPDSRDARFQLGALYEKLDRVEDAEREFRVLIASRPQDAAALNYLGYSLADRGLKLEEAEALIRRAVALEPANGAFRDSLGWARYKQGKYAEAVEELRQALLLSPEDAAIWDHWGDAWQAAGRPEKAWASWKSASVRDPADEKVARKLAAAEAALPPEELGGRLLGLLSTTQGGLSSLAAPCEISGTILRRPIRYSGLLSFKARDGLSLELLGPLFVPVFRMSLSGKDSFSMDPLDAPGVPPGALQDFLHRAAHALRDYLDGAVFEGRPAVYRKGWRSSWIDTPARQLFLDAERRRVVSAKASGEDQVRLSLDEFLPRGGRQLPAVLHLEGKGFSVELRLQDPAVTFSSPLPEFP